MTSLRNHNNPRIQRIVDSPGRDVQKLVSMSMTTSPGQSWTVLHHSIVPLALFRFVFIAYSVNNAGNCPSLESSTYIALIA